MSEGKNKAASRRILLAGDTTLDPLGRLLERSAEGPQLQSSAAPYGQVYQILLDANHPAWEFQPDVLVVWTAAYLTLPSFGKLLRFECDTPATAYKEGMGEVEQFAEAVLRAAPRVGLVLVPTWALPAHERWIQSLTWRNGFGPANFLAKANLLLAERFATQQNVILLDSTNWQASLGRTAYDLRMYAVAKILYSQPMLEKAAVEIKAVLRGALGQAKKVVVCDLDNTLWGGVVGDDGMQNLKLGAPDPLGECFCSFQKALKALSSRGILLAICSKNDEKVAMSAIEEHPAMLLRKGDFAAWKINWNDKAKNLLELAEELNLGLDSFVFLDDSPQERDQIRQILPQVFTPDLPASPSEFAPFLTSLNCFETTSLGKEDLERTAMYQAERGRKEALDLSGGVENWLRSLEIKVQATPLCRENLPRAAQLLNKTNQFNLSLRRMDEASFWAWSQKPGNAVYTFHVSDRFGDFGLTGLASFSADGKTAQIVDFVMSCRVMGKKVEEALLAFLVAQARAAGAKAVTAPIFDGPRNGPAKTFFGAKFANGAGALLDLTRVSIPSEITLKEKTLELATAQ